MGRFNSLEINDAPAPETPGASGGVPSPGGEPVKDAQYFLDAADKHFFRLEYEPALQNYSRAAGIDAGALEAWTGQVMALLELGEYREAALWYGNAVDVVGESAGLLALRALIAARTGDFDRACGYSDASLEHEGATGFPFVARGEIFLYARRNAERCFDQACALSPDWKTRWMIADGCCFYGKTAAVMLGLKFLQPLLDMPGPRPEIYLQSARIHLLLGKRKAAAAALDQAEGLAPDLARAPELRKQCRPPSFWDWLYGRK